MERWKGEFKFRGEKIFSDFLPPQKKPFRVYYVDMDFITILDSRFRREQKIEFSTRKVSRNFFSFEYFFFFLSFPILLLKYSNIIKKKKKNNIQLENTNFLN